MLERMRQRKYRNDADDEADDCSAPCFQPGTRRKFFNESECQGALSMQAQRQNDAPADSGSSIGSFATLM
jgi:hypothetical protein